METHLKIIGSLMIFLALIHAGFPRYFNWKEELKPLQLINKQLMEVHTFFVALTVFLMGLICITITPTEVNTPLGKKIMLGLCLFWAVRVVTQFFWYSPRLWKGKPFEFSMHILFSAVWIYFTSVFYVVWRA